MSGYFEMNSHSNPSSHWLPVHAAGSSEGNPINYTTDTLIDPLEHDPTYAKKIMEFESTLQERIKEEQREEEIAFVQRWTHAGLQIVALITEHLVSHPFVVLRRQCQVNNKLSRYHFVPITLVPVIVNLHRWQGVTCLWKGVGSVLVIKGLTLAVQDLLSKITFWPKEVTLYSSSKQFGKHIMLKCITCAIVTPFYSASLLETVQSEIASERPEFLDVFKEGLRRLLSFCVPQKGRMLPVWSLIVPTAVYFIVKHFMTLFMQSVVSKVIILNHDFQHRKQGAIPKDFDNKNGKHIKLTASLVAALSTDIVLYPLETVLHRLHLQGTRTIIDNLDDGLSVTPILTNFEGVVDCYEVTVREEGICGLYKGFGAVILQCLTYTSIIKLSRFVLIHVSLFLFKNDSSYLVPASALMNQEIPQSAEFKTRRPLSDRKKFLKDNDFSSDSDGPDKHNKF